MANLPLGSRTRSAIPVKPPAFGKAKIKSAMPAIVAMWIRRLQAPSAAVATSSAPKAVSKPKAKGSAAPSTALDKARIFLSVLLEARRDYTTWRGGVAGVLRSPGLEGHVDALQLWKEALDQSIDAYQRLLAEHEMPLPAAPEARVATDKTALDQVSGALTRHCAFFFRFYEARNNTDLALPVFSKRAAVAFTRVFWEYQAVRVSPALVALSMTPSDLMSVGQAFPRIADSTPEEEAKLARVTRSIACHQATDLGLDAGRAS